VAKASQHFNVKFTRRGMEPPMPFGKTHVVVCAANRNEAKEMVPASSYFPITAAPTTKPVDWPYRCHCEVKTPTQLDTEIAEVLNK
jgi:hypothetical protein